MNIRKKLGQNFLNSKSIAKFIVNSAKISKSDVVYEVGIGKGILTPFLCEKSKKVISVEKDYRLYEESKIQPLANCQLLVSVEPYRLNQGLILQARCV